MNEVDVAFDQNEVKKLDILVVDDDLQVLDIVESFLQLGGHHIRTASSADEAINFIEQLAPDILITDLRMEPMDGMGLAMLVRRRFPQIRIMLMTGHLPDYVGEGPIELRLDGCIMKPFKSEHFLKAVQRVAQRPQQF